MRSLLVLCMCLWAVSASAATQEILPGLVVVGWDRLTLARQEQLAGIMRAAPPTLAPWLRVITVDNAPIPEPWASEICAPNGEFLSHRPCGFNILANPVGSENPFPPDAPESLQVSTFAAVVVHEYGHQIAHGTAIEQPWVDRLLREAGREPMRYLRSMIPAGYFLENPQEFIASMWGEWGTCSRCALRLGLARWQAGIPEPLDQVILLIALSGFRHGFLNDNGAGTVVAYAMMSGVPIPEFWRAMPWHCGGPSNISGPDFRLALVIDDTCHVTAITATEGL